MRERGRIGLSSAGLVLELEVRQGLTIRRCGRGGARAWTGEQPTSPVFSAHVDGQRMDGQTPGLVVRSAEVMEPEPGVDHLRVEMVHEPRGIAVEVHFVLYRDQALLEAWTTISNRGSGAVRIERLDSISLDVREGAHELMYFTGAWGREFEPVRAPLTGPVRLGSRSGRSSNGTHPWFALFRDDGEVLAGSVMWSGNWAVRFEPLDRGGYRLRCGLPEEGFSKQLLPSETMESPHVALALGGDAGLNTVSTRYARVWRRHWAPRNELSTSLPVEWNHWWPYEDEEISSEVFRRNADVAREIGVDVCTLDAGWFGPPQGHWYDYRGDWDVVNTERFPEGIRALSDYVHEGGMSFGLWCEIEAVGHRARLAEEHPELLALRSGEPLGYVCFGCPAAREWALRTLERLITEYRCDWIKLDFNVDPGPGCDREDHGHGRGDGLYEHYRGYYQVLERLRARHPQVVLESCSSGGLRIDLGLIRRTHLTFLSDPDWPEHGLQLRWGASTMLAPDACLHWSWSEWRTEHPRQTFDPRSPELAPHQLDYYTRIGMLGAFGLSQRLPELPGWVADRLRWHVNLYKDVVRRFVREGDLYRLTEQPRRDGRGDRWAGFQYALPDGSEHLAFVFRLDGGESERVLRFRELDPGREYEVRWLTQPREERASGQRLMADGLRFRELREEDSAILLLRAEG